MLPLPLEQQRGASEPVCSSPAGVHRCIVTAGVQRCNGNNNVAQSELAHDTQLAHRSKCEEAVPL